MLPEPVAQGNADQPGESEMNQAYHHCLPQVRSARARLAGTNESNPGDFAAAAPKEKRSDDLRLLC